MSKSKLPITYLTLSFVLIMVLLFQGASQFITYFKTGANKNEMLMLATESVNSFYQPKINWLHDTNRGRQIEESTLQKVTKDYLASYYYQFQAYKIGESTPLHDHFTDKSRDHLALLTASFGQDDANYEATTIEHNASIDFYAEDGTIITLEDEVRSYYKITSADGSIMRFNDISKYRVMLLLEDNFWRIRHKVKVPKSLSPDPTKTTALNQDIIIEGKNIFINDTLFQIKGMNYYPQKYPWTEMWLHFDSLDLENDFSLIQETGFNTLRVFVPYDLFGRAAVKAEESRKLNTLLNIAQDHDLKVIVTLFDFFLGYKVEEWTLSDRHAEQMIKTFASHPAILAWDIKNEPDLDFDQSGKADVLAWIKFMSERIHIYDSTALVTVGWSQPEYAKYLEDELDLLSFHYYKDPSDLAPFLDSAQFVIDKPLFLGETGKHSFSAWWYPFSSSEQDQYDYYQELLLLCNQYNLHLAPWTLYDFKKIPTNVVGHLPWRKKPQKAYGIISQDGTKKKVYQLLKDFNLNTNSNE